MKGKVRKPVRLQFDVPIDVHTGLVEQAKTLDMSMSELYQYIMISWLLKRSNTNEEQDNE